MPRSSKKKANRDSFLIIMPRRSRKKAKGLFSSLTPRKPYIFIRGIRKAIDLFSSLMPRKPYIL
jgi:hypothetical protein